jgi:hypothetical protein
MAGPGSCLVTGFHSSISINVSVCISTRPLGSAAVQLVISQHIVKSFIHVLALWFITLYNLPFEHQRFRRGILKCEGLQVCIDAVQCGFPKKIT